MVDFNDLLNVYELAKKNKKRSHDTIFFEINKFKYMTELYQAINNRTLVCDDNYAFVVNDPKYREIFATRMKNRIVHHYIHWRLKGIYEQVLSPVSFNNREGYGLHKAIDTYRQLIKEETNNYTEDAWLIHLDLKGYFPNAVVEVAYKQQIALVDLYYHGDDKEDLKYMLYVVLHADPARNCIKYSEENWNFIEKEKSLFNKPTGVGAAIGFLCWQNAMGIYINNEIKWLTEDLGFKLIIFVDDIYIVTKRKEEFLKTIPELRHRLEQKGVKLSEHKFYCQHYTKGIQCLGTRLKFDRKYINNTTFKKANYKLKKLDENEQTIEQILSSVNCYVGMLKKGNNYKKLEEYKNLVLQKFNTILIWNTKKKCFNAKEKYKTRLNQMYGLI